MRRAGCFDGAQLDEAANPAVDMNHEIAGSKARRLGYEVLARRVIRRGRTSRSPRISCSLMTAASAVSNPLSSPSTASATREPASRIASCQEATGERSGMP